VFLLVAAFWLLSSQFEALILALRLGIGIAGIVVETVVLVMGQK